jgi:hypothetical protein
MSTVNSSLAELRELAPALNKTADDAARIMLDVETLLTKELGIGVAAETTYLKEQITPKKARWTCLAFRRVDGKFRLAVVEDVVTDCLDENGSPSRSFEEKSTTAWAECPRDVKLDSFPHLPVLLEKLIAAAGAAMQRADEASKTVASILAGKAAAAGNDGSVPWHQRRKPAE